MESANLNTTILVAPQDMSGGMFVLQSPVWRHFHLTPQTRIRFGYQVCEN